MLSRTWVSEKPADKENVNHATSDVYYQSILVMGIFVQGSPLIFAFASRGASLWPGEPGFTFNANDAAGYCVLPNVHAFLPGFFHSTFLPSLLKNSIIAQLATSGKREWKNRKKNMWKASQHTNIFCIISIKGKVCFFSGHTLAILGNEVWKHSFMLLFA